jgi:hypothetical protein
MTLRVSREASADAARFGSRHFPIQHCTAVNSANGGCLIHVSKVHDATSSGTAVASARSPRPTATPPSIADLPEFTSTERALLSLSPPVALQHRPSPLSTEAVEVRPDHRPQQEAPHLSRDSAHRIISISTQVPMDDRNGFATKPRPPRHSRKAHCLRDSARSPRKPAHSPWP